MPDNENAHIQLFENKRIRTAWSEDEQEWYFSIVDVVGVLIGSDYQTAPLPVVVGAWQELRAWKSNAKREILSSHAETPLTLESC